MKAASLISLLFVSLCVGATPKDSKLTWVEENAPKLLKEFDVPSVAIAYTKNNETQFAVTYGEQTWGKEADDKTLYNVASLTKPVVAEAILRYISSSPMELDSPLSQWWVDPDLKGHEWTKLLTPEVVMRHETGFKNWRYETSGVLKFSDKPNTKVGYSGEGYDWLMRAVANASDKEFEALVKEKVFKPAGMNRTAFTFKNWFVGHLAVPYKKGEGVFNVVNWNNYSAADDLRTTIGDYAKFMNFVFSKNLSSEFQENRFSVIRQHNPYPNCQPDQTAQDFCPETSGWALGWTVFEWPDRRFIFHTGGDIGESTITIYDETNEESYVIFTNGANGYDVILPLIDGLIGYDNLTRTFELN